MQSRIQSWSFIESSNFSPYYLFPAFISNLPQTLFPYFPDGNSKLWVTVSLIIAYFFAYGLFFLHYHQHEEEYPHMEQQRVVPNLWFFSVLYPASIWLNSREFSLLLRSQEYKYSVALSSLYISSTKMCSLNSPPSVSISPALMKRIFLNLHDCIIKPLQILN